MKSSGFASKLLLALAAICVVTLGSVLSASADDKPFAFTQSGFVIGTTTNGVNEFLGIPYAAPPVGALRWLPPERYGFFPGFFLKATTFGSQCTQGGGGSENCLFLNVYTPQFGFGGGRRVRAEDRGPGGGFPRGLPVMFWIHGGGLTGGAGSDYDPSELVKKGVIVVTINYRLGLLGFYAQSALDSEGHEAGNYGFMDQQFALNWVRRNIAGFGGDPNQVTIFGESAGGQSVYSQLASPTAAHLFRGAIAESGSYVEFQDYFDDIVTLPIAETTGTPLVPAGNSIATSVGCASETALCLRAVPATTFVGVEPGVLYPFVDGTLLTQTPGQAFASGEFNQVPVISGTNHDEYRIFVADEYDLGSALATLAEYDAAELALWGPTLAPIVDSLYPDSPANDVDGPEALGASGTDGIFACPARNADQLLSQFVTTYTYEFNDENAPPAQSSVPGLTFPLGAYHSAELQYLFVLGGVPAPFTPAQQQLSAAMVTYWTQFAKNLNPNSPTEPVWSPYSTSTDEFQSLIPPTPMVESTFAAEHLCEFWDAF
ncbi:carboxylesterase/lipase family protein [Candidatus Binatus sp.]|uniref:carboxylesterase/lipase family protein n=1 Tax=Candidatus Binatus sp. TaxID=2811406 RepID=UPI003C55E4DE